MTTHVINIANRVYDKHFPESEVAHVGRTYPAGSIFNERPRFTERYVDVYCAQVSQNRPFPWSRLIAWGSILLGSCGLWGWLVIAVLRWVR